jgi:hypothetical protein
MSSTSEWGDVHDQDVLDRIGVLLDDGDRTMVRVSMRLPLALRDAAALTGCRARSGR